MSIRNISLVNFFAEMIKQLQKTQQPQYRLVDVLKDKKGKIILKIQVTGKASLFDTTPEAILANDNLVNLFSAIDIRTITYYACQEKNKPKSEVISKRFCEKQNTLIFGIKDTENNRVNEVTATELSLNKKILSQLSAEDAHMIGYVSHQQTQEHEKNAIQQARNNKNASM